MAKQPRLLIDMERMRHPYSGLGYYCQCLRRGLDELHETEALELHYYGQSREGAICQQAFKPWHRFVNTSTRYYDLVHITHQEQHYMSHLWGYRGRIVLTLHDLNFLYERLSPRTRERRLTMARHLISRADVVVCISHYVLADLERYAQLLGLRASTRLEVIHNGITFAPAPLERPKGLDDIDFERPYLLNIGVFQPKKQQHLLIETLPHLPKEVNLVFMFSSADATYRAEVQERADKLGVTERIVAICQGTAEQKYYLLKHATAYVHPSLAEGFGIPPIEAMALGRPTFVSGLTSLPEICGQEAYYLDKLEGKEMAHTITKGLANYTSDPTKPERLMAWANQYDYKRMASDYLHIYQSIL